jgi:putative ABC transport system permease protein
MMSRLVLWLALRTVEMVALLVPAAARRDWRREWHAELRHRAALLQRRPHRDWRTNMDLMARALGSFPDAAWIRRQFTLDADAAHDAAHIIRMLLKTPGFAAIIVLVFAVGIGATTAIVSVADALFMRPIAVAAPDRVMTIWQYNRETGAERLDVAPANAIDWLKRSHSFESIATVEPFAFNINFAGREPDYLTAAIVGEQFFDVIGAPVLHGRTFLPSEYRRGGGRVVILSHHMWASRCGANPALVGQGIRLDAGDAYTVVGVMRPGLELRLFNDRGRRPEPFVWLPKQGFADFEPNLRGQAFWNVLGRLRPNISLSDAQAEFETLSAQLAREYPLTNAAIGAQVVPLRAHLVGSLRDVLPLLLGAAVILLVVACANVANLLLARGAARGREFAVRQALGASRVRLIRQLLVESLLLAAVGGVAGLALARWTLDTIAALRPMDIALVDHIPIDARAALIAAGVTIAAAIIAGLTPAMQLSRPAAVNALKEGRSSSRRGVRGALIIMEVAAALVLAVGAGLLVRSFLIIQRVDPGFRRDDVSVLQVFASRRLDTPQKRIVFFEQALDRLRGLPGVVAAGGVTSMPFGEARIIVRVPLAMPGRPPASGESGLVYATAISGDYLRAMNVPLVAGRIFAATDTARSRQVVLVSQSAARQFWPGSEPIGSKVQFRFAGASYDAEVVGVVGDVRHEALDRPAAAEVFVPYAQSGFYGLTLVVRTQAGSAVSLQTFKEQIWALDPLQSIFNAARLEYLVSKTLVGQRFNLFVLGGFALATLLLAVAGVYGVMSFFTSQRTREFGVRLALGAGRGDIVRLVLGEGLALTALGVIGGVMVALPSMKFLGTLLFGVEATDPATFLTVSAALVIVAAAACYLPASRAIKLDPSKALRLE